MGAVALEMSLDESAGAVGFGLVWGWLLVQWTAAGLSPRQATVLALVSAAVPLTLGILRNGWTALLSAAAALLAAALHVAVDKDLRRRSGRLGRMAMERERQL